MVNRVGRRAWILSQTTVLACAIGAAFEYTRCKHSARPDAAFESRFFLALSVVFFALFIVRFVYKGLVTKCDFFAEEMEHRKMLAKMPC
jgi:hypothetical protein